MCECLLPAAPPSLSTTMKQQIGTRIVTMATKPTTPATPKVLKSRTTTRTKTSKMVFKFDPIVIPPNLLFLTGLPGQRSPPERHPPLLTMHRISLKNTLTVVSENLRRKPMPRFKHLIVTGVTKVFTPTLKIKTSKLVLCSGLALSHKLLITFEMPGPSSFALTMTNVTEINSVISLKGAVKVTRLNTTKILLTKIAPSSFKIWLSKKFLTMSERQISDLQTDTTDVVAAPLNLSLFLVIEQHTQNKRTVCTLQQSNSLYTLAKKSAVNLCGRLKNEILRGPPLTKTFLDEQSSLKIIPNDRAPI